MAKKEETNPVEQAKKEKPVKTQPEQPVKEQIDDISDEQPNPGETEGVVVATSASIVEEVKLDIPKYSTLTVRVAKLREDAVIPQYAHLDDKGIPMDMCMDLTAVELEYDLQSDCYIYRTGLQIEPPQGFGSLVTPRSSNRRTDAYLCNTPGVLDYGYAGDYTICFKNRTSLEQRLYNLTTESILHAIKSNLSNFSMINELVRKDPFAISDEKKIEFALENAPYKVGERIAQLVILPYPFIAWKQVDSIPDLRGGGFGSTGK